jgi:hypothetical protein
VHNDAIGVEDRPNKIIDPFLIYRGKPRGDLFKNLFDK